MKPDDYLGLAVFVGFYLWWVLFPNSKIIRFYEWLHRKRMSMPRPLVVRAVGLLWIAFSGWCDITCAEITSQGSHGIRRREFQSCTPHNRALGLGLGRGPRASE